MEDNYKYKENTLLHAIGFDLYKLDSIFKHGILSSDEAKKRNISIGRSFNGYNLDDTISFVRYIYINPSDLDSSYNRFIKNGISLIVEDVPFIYDYNERYIDHKDEVLVKDKVDVDKIKGISIPSKYLNSSLQDLPMFSLYSFNYINIKETCSNLINYCSTLGYKLTTEEKLEYNNLLYLLSISLEDRLRNRSDLEKEDIANEDKILLSEFISYIVNKTFSLLLNKEDVSLYDVVSYINSKSLNLPIYINYNIVDEKRR